MKRKKHWDNNLFLFFPLSSCFYSFKLLLECYSYSYLDDLVRAQGYYSGYYGYYQCDNYLQFGWYRFGRAAGTQMATSCVGKNRCGSHAPGWLSTAHPSEDDGIVNGTVCFHWSSSCCHWLTNIRVRNCSGFYVYELGPPPTCRLRYCGNGGGMLHLQFNNKSARNDLCGRRKQRVPFHLSPIPSPFPSLPHFSVCHAG